MKNVGDLVKGQLLVELYSSRNDHLSPRSSLLDSLSLLHTLMARDVMFLGHEAPREYL